MPGRVSRKLKRETKTLRQAIGAVVTELRLKKKWSQGRLGVKAGYSTSWVNRLEKGKINPTLELMVVLADTFQLQLSQFFARAERRQLKKRPKSERPHAPPASSTKLQS